MSTSVIRKTLMYDKQVLMRNISCVLISREERERNIDMPYIAHIYFEIYYNLDYYIDGKSICSLIWDCCRVWLTCSILSLFIRTCFIRVLSFYATNVQVIIHMRAVPTFFRTLREIASSCSLTMASL